MAATFNFENVVYKMNFIAAINYNGFCFILLLLANTYKYNLCEASGFLKGQFYRYIVCRVVEETNKM